MALTGNKVKDTYLDLVQLEQSGAGLPSHAGENARLYDGDGNLIVARTNAHDRNDHYPQVIADGTFEWLTDMNQAELVTAGWVFPTGVVASAANGFLYLEFTHAGVSWGQGDAGVLAYYDFDTPLSTGVFWVDVGVGTPHYPLDVDRKIARNNRAGVGLADTVTNDSWFGGIVQTSTSMQFKRYTTMGVYSTFASGTPDIDSLDGYTALLGLTADGTNVKVGCGPRSWCSIYATTAESGGIGMSNTNGFIDVTAIADTSTFNRMIIYVDDSYDGYCTIGPIRRFV